ncbi:unnamed protein product [Closterium sp. NIES-53]
MYHRIDQSDKAIEVLQSLLSSSTPSAPAAPLDLTAVNILAELYMTKGSFQEALAVVERARASLCPGEALPVDLGAKAGTCLVRLGRFTDAQVSPVLCCVPCPALFPAGGPGRHGGCVPCLVRLGVGRLRDAQVRRSRGSRWRWLWLQPCCLQGLNELEWREALAGSERA